MKKYKLLLLAVVISLLPLGYLALAWSSFPQVVPIHFGIDTKPDRWGDKSQLWFIAGLISLISILVYLLLTNLDRFDPKRKNAVKSQLFVKLAFGMVLFMAVLSFFTIYSIKGSTLFQKLFFPLMGLLFAFIGNYMINIKPNYFAGFRLPWTLSDDENWRKTHQLGGKLWFAGGLVIAAVCLLLPSSAAFIFFLAAVLILVFVPIVYSYRLFRNAQ